MKNFKKKLTCLVMAFLLYASIIPLQVNASEISEDGQIANTFNGCKNSVVNLSISCNESDEFTFECTDNCEMEYKYVGYSSVQIGGFSSYSKSYELIFKKSSEHIIRVYKNGNFMENDRVIVAENHTWDSGEVEEKPTCEKEGEIKYECSNCKNTKTEKTQATGHKYKENVTKEVTCVTDGIKSYRCVNCRESYTEKIKATGHKYMKDVTEEATCMASGIKYYRCENCRELRTENIPATGHNYTESITREATCSTNGVKSFKCANCGDAYTKDIPAIGHNFGEWGISKNPTIFENGEQAKICGNCGMRKTKKIDKLKSSVTISKKKLSLKKRKTYKLKIKNKSEGDMVAKWTSSKPKVVSVNKKTGKIKAKKKGKATIIVKMKSGCKATCKVTVK